MRSDWFVETLESLDARTRLTREQAIQCVSLIKSASISAGGRVQSASELPDAVALREYAVYRAKASLDRYARLKHRRESFLRLANETQSSEQLIEYLQGAVAFARLREPGVDEYARDTSYDEFSCWKASESVGRLLLEKLYEIDDMTLLNSGDYLTHVIALIDKAKEDIKLAIGIIVWDGSEGHPVANLIAALERAIKRGVKVDIYNNLESSLMSDTKLTHRMKFTLSHIQSFGGNLISVNRDRSFHAKLIIVDQTQVAIGSHNWSGNSLANYAEISVVCNSTDLARAFSRSLRQGLDQ